MIDIGGNEKIIDMRVFLTVLIFITLFKSWAKANDIREYQIEGMSIGDSLLEFMTEEEIKLNILDYFPNERKYYIVGKNYDLNTYEQVEIYLKTNDQKYKIRTIGGFITASGNECLQRRDEIDKEFKEIFSNLKTYSATLNHAYDKSGKSKQKQTNYVFGASAHEDNHIRTECVTWSEEIKQKDGFIDSLMIIAMTSEILTWINNNYN